MNKYSYGDRHEVYDQAIAKFGETTQCIVAIEEMSEVIKAITKFMRCPADECSREQIDSIIEKVADATIMLEQLRLIFGINEEVCEAMDKKIERLKERVGE